MIKKVIALICASLFLLTVAAYGVGKTNHGHAIAKAKAKVKAANKHKAVKKTVKKSLAANVDNISSATTVVTTSSAVCWNQNTTGSAVNLDQNTTGSAINFPSEKAKEKYEKMLEKHNKKMAKEAAKLEKLREKLMEQGNNGNANLNMNNVMSGNHYGPFFKNPNYKNGLYRHMMNISQGQNNDKHDNDNENDD